MFKSIKDTRKGFTLIELLVVIAIIGILSSVVLASLSTARAKSRDGKRVSDLGQVQLALELYFDAYQSYPTTTPIASTNQIEGAVQVLANAGMLPKAPTPPNSNATVGPKYWYRGITAAGAECLGTNVCTSYAIATTLERADNAVLATDADQTGTAGGVMAGWGAYAAAPGANTAGGKIYGDSQACDAVATGPDQCYDIKP